MSELGKQSIETTKKKIDNSVQGFRRAHTGRKHLVIVIYEIFFRKNMGEEYFDKGKFIAILTGLTSMKFLLNYTTLITWFNTTILASAIGVEGKPYPFCFLDIFIVLCFIMGGYHLANQKQLKSKKIVVDPHSIGVSRFISLGKFFNKAHPRFGALLFAEPLVALTLSFLTFYDSFILGIIALIGVVRLWYENYLVVKKYKETTNNEAEKVPQSQNLEVIKVAQLAHTDVSTNESLDKNVPHISPDGQEEPTKEKPSFTSIFYHAIGERIDQYLTDHPGKVSSSILLQKIAQVRAYFKGLSSNRRRSFNFFLSAVFIYLLFFLTGPFVWPYNESEGIIMYFTAPTYFLFMWSAFAAFSQLKFVDALISKITKLAFVLDFGIIPDLVKNKIAGIIKFILFLILAFFTAEYIGIPYLIYRSVIAFVNPDKLPRFEKV